MAGSLDVARGFHEGVPAGEDLQAKLFDQDRSVNDKDNEEEEFKNLEVQLVDQEGSFGELQASLTIDLTEKPAGPSE